MQGYAVMETGWTRSQARRPGDHRRQGGPLAEPPDLLPDVRDRPGGPDGVPDHPGAARAASSCWPTDTSTRPSRAASPAAPTSDWLRDLYGFAVAPDLVFYLQIGVQRARPARARGRQDELLGKRHGHELRRRPVRQLRRVPERADRAVRRHGEVDNNFVTLDAREDRHEGDPAARDVPPTHKSRQHLAGSPRPSVTLCETPATYIDEWRLELAWTYTSLHHPHARAGNCFTCPTVYVPKWKMLAASAASAWPAVSTS